MNITNQKRSMIFGVILVSSIMASMLSTALTTALPSIMKDLGISAATGQWLTSIYSLIMGIAVLCSAFLIRRFPTKRLYVGALGIFVLGLAISVVSQSFAVMMAGRVLQSAGNGIILAVAQVVILTLYPQEKRGSVMGIYGLATGVAPIIAPSLAGIIVDTIGWRMIFVIVIAVCLIALVFALLSFENVLENSPCSLDLASVVLCTLTFTGITLGVGRMGVHSFFSPSVLGCVAAGIVSGILFTRRQLKLETPFLNLRIFSNYEFRIAVIGSMLMYLIMMAATMLFPLELQNVFGKSATVSALVNMPGSIAMAVANPLTGKLYDKLGVKKIFVAGSLFLMANALGFSFFTESTPLVMFGIFTVIRCLGIACIMMPLVTYSVSRISKDKVPSATSLITSLRTVAGSIGASVFVSIATVASRDGFDVYGVQTAYRIIAVLCIVLLCIALLGIRSQKKEV